MRDFAQFIALLILLGMLGVLLGVCAAEVMQ